MVKEAGNSHQSDQAGAANESRGASKVTIQVRREGDKCRSPRLDRTDRPGIEICCSYLAFVPIDNCVTDVTSP